MYVYIYNADDAMCDCKYLVCVQVIHTKPYGANHILWVPLILHCTRYYERAKARNV